MLIRDIYGYRYHLWVGSCAYTICPHGMQDGAANILLKQLSGRGLTSTATERVIFENAFTRLTSRNPAEAWTSGQWMTELAGGSDVSGTETTATYEPRVDKEATDLDGNPLGPWVLRGFKWFTSATDSDMAIVLGKTNNGLSIFYAPTKIRVRKRQGQDATLPNGIHVRRLKSKLGTKAVPTAELELESVRGYLIGKEGDGIREISQMLNITRVNNAVTCMGFYGRGIAISKAFASTRNMVGKGSRRNLATIPLHVHTMAQEQVTYRAHMAMTFFVAYLLGISERGFSYVNGTSIATERLKPATTEDASLLLRFLTPVNKALTAKAAIAGLQECLESLGGIGYLENEESPEFNIARLYRDVNVCSIWEGTTDVLGTDFVKVVKGRHGTDTLLAMDRWFV